MVPVVLVDAERTAPRETATRVSPEEERKPRMRVQETGDLQGLSQKEHPPRGQDIALE